MSYTPSTEEIALQAWAESLMPGTTLIFEYQDAPRPETPFAGLLALDDTRVGEPATELDATSPVGADWTERAAQLVSGLARVTFYGKTASTLARDFAARWGLPSAHQRAADLGLSIRNVTPARRVPLAMSQTTEDRKVVDILYYYVAEADAVGQGLEIIENTFEEPGA